jgi:methionyl-tRNA formyltransferase
MNLVFAGTPAFAVPSLEALHAAGHNLLAVYTQPDRPAGRGRGLAASAVKQCALKLGLDVHQPATLKDAAEHERLRALAPDAMIVIAYGLLLPKAVLAIPKHGCLNVHASLLPRWRGAAPIARAIEAGDPETGITIMQMEEGLDTGPMLMTAHTPIADDDTAATLHDRLARLGAETLVRALEALAHGRLTAAPQDVARACYAKKLTKDEARLDWSQPALALHRRIRAFNPWPVAFTTWRGEPLRIWAVAPLASEVSHAAPGTVIGANAGAVRVATGNGVLAITRLQREGGKPLAAGDFVNGTRLAAGDRFV